MFIQKVTFQKAVKRLQSNNANWQNFIGVCINNYVIYQNFFQKLMSWSYKLQI